MGDGIALNDSVLTSNISSVNYLYLSYLDIIDLTGIKDFTNLTTLDINSTKITNLDVSNSYNLQYIYGHHLFHLKSFHN